MTQENIHYLIGWVGAVFVLLILCGGISFGRKHKCDKCQCEEDTEHNEEITGSHD